jgi:hypothetical protein
MIPLEEVLPNGHLVTLHATPSRAGKRRRHSAIRLLQLWLVRYRNPHPVGERSCQNQTRLARLVVYTPRRSKRIDGLVGVDGFWSWSCRPGYALYYSTFPRLLQGVITSDPSSSGWDLMRADWVTAQMHAHHFLT